MKKLSKFFPVKPMYRSDRKIVIPIIEKTITTGIQNGENTHHQDQSILFVSFKIKKTIKTIVANPNPPLLLLLPDIY